MASNSSSPATGAQPKPNAARIFVLTPEMLKKMGLSDKIKLVPTKSQPQGITNGTGAGETTNKSPKVVIPSDKVKIIPKQSCDNKLKEVNGINSQSSVVLPKKSEKTPRSRKSTPNVSKMKTIAIDKSKIKKIPLKLMKEKMDGDKQKSVEPKKMIEEKIEEKIIKKVDFNLNNDTNEVRALFSEGIIEHEKADFPDQIPDHDYGVKEKTEQEKSKLPDEELANVCNEGVDNSSENDILETYVEPPENTIQSEGKIHLDTSEAHLETETNRVEGIIDDNSDKIMDKSDLSKDSPEESGVDDNDRMLMEELIPCSSMIENGIGGADSSDSLEAPSTSQSSEEPKLNEQPKTSPKSPEKTVQAITQVISTSESTNSPSNITDNRMEGDSMSLTDKEPNKESEASSCDDSENNAEKVEAILQLNIQESSEKAQSVTDKITEVVQMTEIVEEDVTSIRTSVQEMFDDQELALIDEKSDPNKEITTIISETSTKSPKSDKKTEENASQFKLENLNLEKPEIQEVQSQKLIERVITSPKIGERLEQRENAKQSLEFVEKTSPKSTLPEKEKRNRESRERNKDQRENEEKSEEQKPKNSGKSSQKVQSPVKIKENRESMDKMAKSPVTPSSFETKRSKSSDKRRDSLESSQKDTNQSKSQQNEVTKPLDPTTKTFTRRIKVKPIIKTSRKNSTLKTLVPSPLPSEISPKPLTNPNFSQLLKNFKIPKKSQLKDDTNQTVGEKNETESAKIVDKNFPSASGEVKSSDCERKLSESSGNMEFLMAAIDLEAEKMKNLAEEASRKSELAEAPNKISPKTFNKSSLTNETNESVSSFTHETKSSDLNESPSAAQSERKSPIDLHDNKLESSLNLKVESSNPNKCHELPSTDLHETPNLLTTSVITSLTELSVCNETNKPGSSSANQMEPVESPRLTKIVKSSTRQKKKAPNLGNSRSTSKSPKTPLPADLQSENQVPSASSRRSAQKRSPKSDLNSVRPAKLPKICEESSNSEKSEDQQQLTQTSDVLEPMTSPTRVSPRKSRPKVFEDCVTNFTTRRRKSTEVRSPVIKRRGRESVDCKSDVKIGNRDEVKTPDISEMKTSDVNEVKTPDISEMKTSDVNEVKTPDFSQLQKLNVNEVKTPDSSLVKTSDVKEVKTPDFNYMKMSVVNEVKISDSSHVKTSDVNEVKTPDFSNVKTPVFNELETPNFNQVKTSVVTAMKTPNFSQVKMPDVNEVKTSGLNEVKTSDVNEMKTRDTVEVTTSEVKTSDLSQVKYPSEICGLFSIPESFESPKRLVIDESRRYSSDERSGDNKEKEKFIADCEDSQTPKKLVIDCDYMSESSIPRQKLDFDQEYGDFPSTAFEQSGEEAQVEGNEELVRETEEVTEFETADAETIEDEDNENLVIEESIPTSSKTPKPKKRRRKRVFSVRKTKRAVSTKVPRTTTSMKKLPSINEDHETEASPTKIVDQEEPKTHVELPPESAENSRITSMKISERRSSLRRKSTSPCPAQVQTIQGKSSTSNRARSRKSAESTIVAQEIEEPKTDVEHAGEPIENSKIAAMKRSGRRSSLRRKSASPCPAQLQTIAKPGRRRSSRKKSQSPCPENNENENREGTQMEIIAFVEKPKPRKSSKRRTKSLSALVEERLHTDETFKSSDWPFSKVMRSYVSLERMIGIGDDDPQMINNRFSNIAKFVHVPFDSVTEDHRDEPEENPVETPPDYDVNESSELKSKKKGQKIIEDPVENPEKNVATSPSSPTENGKKQSLITTFFTKSPKTTSKRRSKVIDKTEDLESTEAPDASESEQMIESIEDQQQESGPPDLPPMEPEISENVKSPPKRRGRRRKSQIPEPPEDVVDPPVLEEQDNITTKSLDDDDDLYPPPLDEPEDLETAEKPSRLRKQPSTRSDEIEGKGLSGSEEDEEEEADEEAPVRRRRTAGKRGRRKGKKAAPKDQDYEPRKRAGRKPVQPPITSFGKTKNVTCAKCKEEMTVNNWSRHNLLKHNNMAWREGEEPLDLDNEVVVRRILSKTKKRKSTFVCETCNEVKKSVAGFMSHIIFCGKSNEEKFSLMWSCPICRATFMPSSREYHERMHLLEEKEAAKKKDEQSEQVDNRSKRIAAQKAVAKIQEFTDMVKGSEEPPAKRRKLASRIHHFIQFPATSKRIPGVWKGIWGRAIQNNQLAYCRQPGCDFSTDSVHVICQHYSTCNFTPSTALICKICKFFTENRDEIETHLKTEHAAEIGADDSDFKASEGSESDDDHEIPDSENGNKKPRKRTINSTPVSKSIPAEKPLFIRNASEVASVHYTTYLPTLRWTIEFQEKHYHLVLFDDLPTNAFEAVKSPENYLPQLKISLKTAHKQPKVKPADNKIWKRWKRFEGDVVNQVITIFTGGPVWALAWLPIPTTAYKDEANQYLAVSTHPTMEATYETGRSYAFKNSLQIWELGPLDNAAASGLKAPELSYIIAHEGGTAWALEWCPSGTYHQNRMGLLAAGMSSGHVYIYSLPFPEHVNVQKPKKGPRVVKTDPVMILHVNSVLEDEIGTTAQVTSLNWSKTSEHDTLVAGFSNGFVAIWDLKTMSPFLRRVEGGTIHLDAAKYFFAHGHAVMFVTMVPIEGKRFLASSSMDRSSKLWDLEDVGSHVWCIRKGIAVNAAWMTHWPTMLTAYDDVLGWRHTQSYLTGIRDPPGTIIPMLPTNSPSFAAASSDWANGVCHGTQAGEIIAVFPPQLLHIKEIDKACKRRWLVSNVELVHFKAKGMKAADDEADRPEYAYGPEEYKDCVEQFGVIFHDDLDNKRGNDWRIKNDRKAFLNPETTQPWPIEQYPFASVNRIAWNSNAWSFLWMAAGYQNGLIRVLRLKKLSNNSIMNDLLSKHAEFMMENDD